MLEKPDIEDEEIIDRLHDAHGLGVKKIAFLPLGRDLNTAVYRAVSEDGTAYFVKLRRGEFDEATVTVPKFLYDMGMKQIIPPLTTQGGRLWANLDPFNLILYPFVEGRNGFQVKVTDQHRVEFGNALKRFHTADIPPTLTKTVQRETFSPQWREKVRWFLERIDGEVFDEAVAAEAAVFLRCHRDETLELVNRAEQLAAALQAKPLEFILCHGDIHGWNFLIDGNGRFYMVDWDTLVFAPKERDLMFVGSGLGGNGHSLEEEERLFYQGYGETKIDLIGIAYYRYERIIEDIAIFCQQTFLSDEGGKDREQALQSLKSNFQPNGTIEVAYGLE